MDHQQDAETEKEKGNELFKTGDLEGALVHYDRAIELSPSHTFHSNRSAVYCKLERWEEALSDGDQCVELSPPWFKGHVRRGDALMGLKDYERALAAFQEALTCDDGNTDVTASKLEEAKERDMQRRQQMVQEQIKQEVMAFAVAKSQAQQMIAAKEFDAAEAKYSEAMSSMSELVSKLPEEQQGAFTQLIEKTKAEMAAQLQKAKA